MWNSIQQKIIRVNKAIGIEIILLPEDKVTIHTLSTFTKKNNVIKEFSSAPINDLSGLAEKINSRIPLSVVINGKGVVIKKINTAQPGTNPLSNIFPNANPDDFYYEVIHAREFDVVSVIRKEVLNDILSKLKKEGFKPILISLGFSSILNILPFVKTTQGQMEIKTNSFIICIGSDGVIDDFQIIEIPAEESQMPEYLVADQYVKSRELLSFAAAINLMSDDLRKPEPLRSEIVTKDREEYRYYKLFTVAGWALLITVFAILLSSFGLYTHYLNKNKDLNISQAVNGQQLLKTQAIENNIKRKELFLGRSGWTGTGRISFYADRIASVTPIEVLLTMMNLYPIKSNGDIEGAVNYKIDTILITGVCNDPSELNQYVNNLKIIPDFKEVAIRNYLYRKESEMGSFSIEIITK